MKVLYLFFLVLVANLVGHMVGAVQAGALRADAGAPQAGALRADAGAPQAGAGAGTGYYTKLSINDAPDGGRFTIEAFMLDFVDDKLAEPPNLTGLPDSPGVSGVSGASGAPGASGASGASGVSGVSGASGVSGVLDTVNTTGRYLLLRFARSSGEDSYIITWDMAIRTRDRKGYQEGLVSLDGLPLDGFFPKGVERWALWWIPQAWNWKKPGDLKLVYGDSKAGLVPLDEKGLKKALRMIPRDLAAKAATKTLNLTAFDVMPVPVEAPPPVYPRSAEGFDYRGNVTVGARIQTDGTVADVVVLHSTAHHILGVAALKAVHQWVFTPGTKDGKVVEGDMVVPVRFELGRR